MPSKWTFVEAVRTPDRLIIAQSGMSGAGKTFTALLVASGICDVTQGRIAYIDTEDKRAKRYAPDPANGYPGFKFFHLPFPPPYNPGRWREVLDAGIEFAAPHGVIVLDSLSHEHEGIGGVLEMQEAELVKMMKGREHMREKLSYAAWSKPKAERLRLIQAVERSPVHLIMCFRAKKKKALVKGADGKTELVDIGWQSITGDDWPFYADVSYLLDDDVRGRPVIQGFDFGKLPDPMLHLIDQRRPLTREDGRALGRYALMLGDVNKPVQLTQAEYKAMVDSFVAQIQQATTAASLVQISNQIDKAPLQESTKARLKVGIHKASQELPEAPAPESPPDSEEALGGWDGADQAETDAWEREEDE